ncbi:MAG: TetR/AcrR family transcriptional regulator [Lachnospiraceae bacterium]|jgi:AcrR family transcriptional regulator|nr:TetR/AcrR family transcriptional regulator [Lachnospiraceae bacterium]
MPRDKTESHRRITEAAREEFLEYGYSEASLRRIATKAGIQVGGLYKHFANKEEMFASLVEPAIEGFYALYHEIEGVYFDELESIGDDYEWEGEDETVRGMKYIYEHLDEFKLLVFSSQGTKYADFIHEVARLEEEVTLRYTKVLKKKGYPVKDVDPLEFHLLTTTYVEAVFQAVVHGLERDEALHYASTLQIFYKPAWKELLGI